MAFMAGYTSTSEVKRANKMTFGGNYVNMAKYAEDKLKETFA
ncbi:hypothetical protein MNB_SUP05-SYMBIONT-4-357 [hydrothermal vent metagenome]|uniref:Uncharacterized protein n=1 Tax=hydrothermal vent metagenome TaxID=652676 RepID=A0A1W1DY94_9ZZZZ